MFVCFKELVCIYMKHIKVVLEENILCKKESTLHKAEEYIHIRGQT
jgi:hypothetical protein